MAEGGIPPKPKGPAPPEELLEEGGIPPEPKGPAPPAELLAEGGIPTEPKGTAPPEELLQEGGTPSEPKGSKPPAELLAEGWKPPEPEGPPPPDEPRCQPQAEEVDSLHLLFSRDLLDYVIRRKVRGWTFSPEYSNACPVTPFSYRIRMAVDWYLNKECINFGTLYHLAFMDERADYDGYVSVIKFLVRTIYHKTKTYADLLRFLFLCAQFTQLAYDRGVEMAPYYALFALKDILCSYCEREKIIPDYFYGTLGPKAQVLIHEDKPIVLFEN